MVKIIGNTTTTPMAIPDWNQTDKTKADYIKNKPSILTETDVEDIIARTGGTVQLDNVLQLDGGETGRQRVNGITEFQGIEALESVILNQGAQSNGAIRIISTVYGNGEIVVYNGDDGINYQLVLPNDRNGTLITEEHVETDLNNLHDWVVEYTADYASKPEVDSQIGSAVSEMVQYVDGKFEEPSIISATNISPDKVESIYKKTLDGVSYLDGMWMKDNSLYTANAYFKRTDFIPVTPNKEYTLCVYYKTATDSGKVSNGKIFDADKNIIADFGDGEGHIINITMPENAKYIQFSVNLASTDTDLSKVGIGVSAMYYQYTKDTKSLDWLEVNADNIPDGTITAEKLNENVKFKLGDEEVKQNHITSETSKVYGDNLLDGATYTDGKYAVSGGEASHSSLSYANIPIVGGKEYAVTVWDKNLVQNILVFNKADGRTVFEFNAQPYYTFTPTDIADNVFIVKAPEEATTLKLNVYITEQSTAIVKEVTRVKKSLDWLEVNAENLSENAYNGIAEKVKEKENAVKYKYGDSLNKPFDFNGKSLVAFGDSITQGYTSPNLEVKPDKCYIKLFADKFGMSLVNKGVGGSCLADTDGNAYTIYKMVTGYTAQKNFVVISGGTNDFNQGKPLGEFDSTDVTTVYGALRGMCEHLKNNLPDATVIFITPIPVTKDFPNAILPLNAYRNAIYEIATLYGFNVVDGSDLGMPTESGEWANEMIANGDGCHPTEAGHALYFRNLCAKLSGGGADQLVGDINSILDSINGEVV